MGGDGARGLTAPWVGMEHLEGAPDGLVLSGPQDLHLPDLPWGHVAHDDALAGRAAPGAAPPTIPAMYGDLLWPAG